MKIVVVVSEFPKVTETFAYRNIVEYDRLGHDARLFHIKRFRSAEVVHDFMRDMTERAFTLPYMDRQVLGALLAEAATAPLRLGGIVAKVIGAHWREPRRGVNVLSYLPKAVALGRWCRREKIDHIHGEFAGHPATAAMIASRISGVPFSFSAHANDIIVSHALLVDKARAARFVRSISRFNITYLTQIKGFPAEKLHLVRCGVTRTTLDTAGPTEPAANGLQILYVGSLIEKKGVGNLIEALAILPVGLAWQCRILGGGNLAGQLAARAAELGLTNSITFEGPKPAEDVAKAYQAAHVVVVPSIVGEQGRVEGIPVVIMEALAHARPVIASALSGIPELVEDGVTGLLVEPGNPQAIRDALVRVAGDWGAAAAIGQRGRERIRTEYVVEDNAAQLARLMAGEK